MGWRISHGFHDREIDRGGDRRDNEESADAQELPVEGDGGFEPLRLAVEPHLPLGLREMRDAVVDRFHRNEDEDDQA